jgi:hypothetical protein
MSNRLLHIRKIFNLVGASRLKFKLKKCTFFQSKCKYLGHFLGHDGIRTDPKKLSAIPNFPKTTKIKALQSFLGACNYYCHFIPNFATIAKSLHELTKMTINLFLGILNVNTPLLHYKMLYVPLPFSLIPISVSDFFSLLILHNMQLVQYCPNKMGTVLTTLLHMHPVSYVMPNHAILTPTANC